MQSLRLGTAGMRGEIGTGLNPSNIINYASAVGSYMSRARVIVGRDTRISSTMLHKAVLSSLASTGCETIDAGVCPAPLLHFAVPFIRAQGGILIGAGHHPDEWNAIVPFNSAGAYMNGIQTQELLDIYHSKNYRYSTWDKIGRAIPSAESLPDAYIEALASNFDIDLIASRKFSIVADFCNGSGSVLARRFASKFKIEMISINDTDSGILPHDPEPRPRSCVQVRSIVNCIGADVGFVFNSDMSRTAIVTDMGEPLSEEYTFPLVADHLLSRKDGARSLVTNICTTRTLDDIAARHGARVEKVKVGQASVVDRMLEVGADICGDGSGSVAMKGAVRGFDSFLTMAVLLEAMARRNTSSSDLAEDLPRYHIVKRKITCPSAHAYTLIRRLKDIYPDAVHTEMDGLRFDWPDGWIHLRAAMTEPIVRLIVEWKTKEEAEERAYQVRSVIEGIVPCQA